MWTLTAALATLWAGLAFLNETTTYHLAPALVTLSPAIGVRARHGEPLSRSAAVAVTSGGLLVVAVALTALVGADSLRGPSLVPGTGPLGESIVVALAAAVYGLVVLGRRRPPWYLRDTPVSQPSHPRGIPD